MLNRGVKWEGNGMQWVCTEEDEQMGLVAR